MKTKLAALNFLARGRCLVATLVAGGLLLPLLASAEGTWIPLQPPTPDVNGMSTMLLLSDGTVMAQGGNSGIAETVNWYKLTPGGTGGYTNGQWSMLNNMHYSRDYYSSDVLTNGNVFVAGAEYGTGTTNAEIYNPVSGSWSKVFIPTGIMNLANTVGSDGGNSQGFIDSLSVVLSNGKVLVFPDGYYTNGQTVTYDPVTGDWATAILENGNNEDEASLIKLPDDSILVIDSESTTSERYIPSLNTWVDDGDVKDDLFSNPGGELGAGFLLPNGNAFMIGSVPKTAIYNPSGSTNPGTWSRGPDIPNNLAAPDAPAAMMNNGKILCALSPNPYRLDGTNYIFMNPTYFYEYDYSVGATGTFTQVHAPNGSYTNNGATYTCRMLDLPDGTVLYTDGNNLYIYKPDGSPLPAGQPAIQSVTWNADGSLHLTGTLFNGISQGAAYGDDAQMDSNYPLVRFTDGGGNVYYGRTYDWSSTSVMTGSRVVTTEFTLPATLPYGYYSLAVVANGNASSPVTFYGPVWVNFNYSPSSPQHGTFAQPYSTLAQGTSAVASGGTIAIIGSTQPSVTAETPTITKAMNIISVSGPSTIGE